jgi:hypothetical protein
MLDISFSKGWSTTLNDRVESHPRLLCTRHYPDIKPLHYGD